MSAGLRRRTRAGAAAAAAKRRRQDGLEQAPDGTVIGRDPRRLSPLELRDLGHRGKPLLQAMRRRCVDCCGGKVDEVRRCTAVACPLWPYRMGTDPWQADPPKPSRESRPAVPASVTLEAAPEDAAVRVPARRPRAAVPATVAPEVAPEAAAVPVTACEPRPAVPATVAPEAAPEAAAVPVPARGPRPAVPATVAPEAAPEAAVVPVPLPAARRRRRACAEAPRLPFLDDAPA